MGWADACGCPIIREMCFYLGAGSQVKIQLANDANACIGTPHVRESSAINFNWRIKLTSITRRLWNSLDFFIILCHSCAWFSYKNSHKFVWNIKNSLDLFEILQNSRAEIFVWIRMKHKLIRKCSHIHIHSTLIFLQFIKNDKNTMPKSAANSHTITHIHPILIN